MVQFIFLELGKIIKRALFCVKELESFLAYLYIERFILHVFQVGHEERHQVLWQEQLSWIIWSQEVVFIVVLDLLFHVLLKSMRIFVEDLFEDIVDLEKLTTWSSEIWARLVVTGWLDQVLVKNAYNITLEDNFGVDIILEFLKCLILLSLFPGEFSLLFPYFLLPFGLDLIKFSLPYSIIFSFDNGLVLVLGTDNTICNDSF